MIQGPLPAVVCEVRYVVNARYGCVFVWRGGGILLCHDAESNRRGASPPGKVFSY